MDVKRMNIFALKGHKIKVTENFLNRGREYDKLQAKKYLEKDKLYTVERTLVSGSWTRVWLQEIPKVGFNSVHFEDAVRQDPKKNREHPDYQKYLKIGRIKE